ncbi:MAG TPA: hypothetical protein VFV39_10615 [Limnobacter sp.]|nr:hypothetical protein [Limnobacter sp.]
MIAKPQFPFPVCVLSFNRPELLALVLEDLSKQTMQIGQIALFQDGAVNEISGLRHCKTDLQEECLALFKKFFPDGDVFHDGINRGISRQFERAELHAFEALNAPAAAFFEDDMRLAPQYLEALCILRKSLPVNKVSYYAAYGTLRETENTAAATAVMPMHHHWGFLLNQHAWQAIYKELAHYRAFVHQFDYRQRPSIEVLLSNLQHGLPTKVPSQDAAKARASANLGYVRLSTSHSFAAYVGKVGAHMDAETYKKQGWRENLIDASLPEAYSLSVEILEKIQAHERFHPPLNEQDVHDEIASQFQGRLSQVFVADEHLKLKLETSAVSVPAVCQATMPQVEDTLEALRHALPPNTEWQNTDVLEFYGYKLAQWAATKRCRTYTQISDDREALAIGIRFSELYAGNFPRRVEAIPILAPHQAQLQSTNKTNKQVAVMPWSTLHGHIQPKVMCFSGAQSTRPLLVALIQAPLNSVFVWFDPPENSVAHSLQRLMNVLKKGKQACVYRKTELLDLGALVNLLAVYE